MCGRDADDVDESAAVVDDEAAYAVAAGVDEQWFVVAVAAAPKR